MNPEDTVRAALQALADHDRPLESKLPAPRMRAPQPLSTTPRVLRPVSRWKTGTAYAVAALAAAATVLVLIRPAAEPVQAPSPVEQAPVQESKVEPPAIPPALTPAMEQESTPALRVVRSPRRTADLVLASAEVQPEVDNNELATEFFPLTDAPMPFEHGQLVRVMVPARTMQRVGLPVRPERWSDRVTADVLVGDEGMPRAIRFVSFQQ